MSDEADTLPSDGGILNVVHQLGLFGAEDVAALTELAKDKVDQWLDANNARLVEPARGRDGMWRVLVAPREAPPTRPAADPKVAEELADQAVAAMRTIGRGLVQEPEVRKITLGVAEQRMQLAEAAARSADAPKLRARLARAKSRLAKLREQSRTTPNLLLAELRDWTAKLPVPGNPPASVDKKEQSRKFDIDAALRGAIKQAAHPNAVFMPAYDALAARITDEERLKLADALDRDIRAAALRGRVFEVLALGCVAAVTGLGVMADALVAAITTPAFYTAADRGGRRIAYTALSNLARPGVIEGYRAVEACTYLMRRERPGSDEMELLAPAMLQSKAVDSRAALVLFAQWLRWENERDPDGPEEGSSLPQFGHVARNLGCSLDSCDYQQLEQVLPVLADDQLGVLLVRHLSDESNRALLLRSSAPRGDSGGREGRRAGQGGRSSFCGVGSRSGRRRHRSERKRRSLAWLPVGPRSRVAQTIMQLVLQQPVRIATGFTDRRRRWAHGNG